MFLAIAVDNLATAQEMTADQEEAEALAREQKEKSAAKEATMFLPNPLLSPVVSVTDTTQTNPMASKPGQQLATGAANKPGQQQQQQQQGKTTTGAAKNQLPTQQQQQLKPPPTTTTTTVSNQLQPSKPGGAAKTKTTSNLDVEKMITRKVDLDYIPGLDDDLKVILPGNLFEIYFKTFN